MRSLGQNVYAVFVAIRQPYESLPPWESLDEAAQRAWHVVAAACAELLCTEVTESTVTVHNPHRPQITGAERLIEYRVKASFDLFLNDQVDTMVSTIRYWDAIDKTPHEFAAVVHKALVACLRSDLLEQTASELVGLLQKLN